MEFSGGVLVGSKKIIASQWNVSRAGVVRHDKPTIAYLRERILDRIQERKKKIRHGYEVNDGTVGVS